jgi:hypothetical protein
MMSKLRINKLSIVVVMLLLLVPITGYFAYQQGLKIGLVSADRQDISSEATVPSTNEEKINKCLTDAADKRQKRWQAQCKDIGKELNENGFCLIPKDAAQHYDDEFNKDRDFCLKLYK